VLHLKEFAVYSGRWKRRRMCGGKGPADGRSGLIGKIINLIRERAEEIKVGQPTRISPDPDDNAFLRVC
jgi:hypothetical protein